MDVDPRFQAAHESMESLLRWLLPRLPGEEARSPAFEWGWRDWDLVRAEQLSLAAADYRAAAARAAESRTRAGRVLWRGAARGNAMTIRLAARRYRDQPGFDARWLGPELASSQGAA